MLSQPAAFMTASQARRAAIAVLLLNLTAVAQPTPRDPPGKFRRGTAEGAGLTPQVWLDDATRALGGIASSALAEAVVFDQPNDSGFGWFMKNDDVFGYGTWAGEMIFANGFAAGDSVSSYMMRFFHSSFDDISGLGGNDAEVSTQLWDGDPFSIRDTGCTVGGISAPIAGTQASFSGIPHAALVDLTAVLPGKPVVDCDHVWGEMTFVRGCRGAWRLSGEFLVSAFTVPADVGSMNAAWLLWACEQFSACNTPNGLNAGFCCNEPALECDHTDGVLDCEPFTQPPGGLATFCGDGAADYFVATDPVEDPFAGYVATVSAPTDTIVSIVVVSVDASPAAGGSSAGVISLTDDEVVLAEGDHNVWLEFRVGDWDPLDIGVQLAAWQLTFDSASYSTGDQGTLTAYVGGGCGGVGDNGPCEADLGPGARCDPPGYFMPLGTCSFAFIDDDRPDFVYAGASIPVVTVDVSQPDVRPAGTVIAGPPNDPPCGPGCLNEFPAGGLYAGTLTTHVPSDSKGCFTMALKHFPASQLVDSNSQFIPLLGIKSADICIETGRCCFNLQEVATGGGGCLDILQTAQTCAQIPGLRTFHANASCSEGCPAVCGDGVINQPDEQCDDGLTGNSDAEPDACRTDCTVPFCGDGVSDTSEDCDDGPLNSDSNADACRTDCVLPICGDDARDTGEECDGSSDALCPGACREDCTCGFCGDGIIDAGLGEDCDGQTGTCPIGTCFVDCTCPTEIPTTSQWGLVVLALLLSVGAKLYFSRQGLVAWNGE